MEYRFTNSMPYLLNRAGVAIGDSFSRRIAQHGVTLPMYRVLAILRQTGDKSLGELSERTTIEMSTLSRLVGSMSRQGLVSRHRLPDNARVVSIEITPQGQELADRLMAIAAQYEAALLDGLNDEQSRMIKAYLAEISHRIQDL